MSFHFENLTLGNLRRITELLEAHDIVSLSHTNRHFYKTFMEDSLWESPLKVYHITQQRVYDILIESGALDLSMIEKLFESTTSNKTIVGNILRMENQVQNLEPAEILQIRENILKFRTEQNLEHLYNALKQAIDNIFYFPVPTLYLLAFMCFIINDTKASLAIIELGLTFDDFDETLLELKQEVEQLHNALQGDGKTPLIVDNELSPFMKKVVKTIFLRYVSPGTRQLHKAGLKKFIMDTNQAPPPSQFLDHVFNNFAEGNRTKFISLEGFEAFYLDLALDDPVETRNDLQKHGFCTKTLQPLSADDNTNRLENLTLKD